MKAISRKKMRRAMRTTKVYSDRRGTRLCGAQTGCVAKTAAVCYSKRAAAASSVPGAGPGSHDRRQRTTCCVPWDRRYSFGYGAWADLMAAQGLQANPSRIDAMDPAVGTADQTPGVCPTPTDDRLLAGGRAVDQGAGLRNLLIPRRRLGGHIVAFVLSRTCNAPATAYSVPTACGSPHRARSLQPS